MNHMSKMLLSVWLVMPALAFANCYAIQDSDLKHYCLAKSKNEANTCYSIRENDAKQLCLAEVKQDKNACYSIRNSDQKNLCLGLVR